MNEEDKKVLTQMEMALRHHRSAGEIDDNTLYKGWVMIAYEFVRRGAVTDALTRLRWCPADYFAVTLGQQMATDEDFRDVSYDLARALVDGGVADISQKFTFFGPVGQA